MALRLGPPRPRTVAGARAPASWTGDVASSLGLLGELAGLVEPARLVAAAPWLARAPRGNGEPVIDLPGWRASEHSNLALRTYLRYLGYSVEPWGLGTNLGRPEADAHRIADQLERDSRGGAVALVGWSLGGTIAREVARMVPDLVSCVVTFGSPVFEGRLPMFATGNATRPVGSRSLDRTLPVRVPVTAIFTKKDAVVDWRACIDHKSPNVEHVEVTSTHMSLGFDPDVWFAVAQALGRHYAG